MSGKWQMVKVPWIIFIRYGSLSFVGPCPWLLLASIMFPIVMFTEGAASTPPPLFSVQCTHSLDLKVASGWCRSFKNLVPEYPYSILHTGHSYIYTEDYKLNWLTPLTGHWLLFLLFVSLTKMWYFVVFLILKSGCDAYYHAFACCCANCTLHISNWEEIQIGKKYFQSCVF